MMNPFPRYLLLTLPSVAVSRRVLVRPPQGWPRDPRPRNILHYLAGGKWAGTAKQAAKELARRIESAARTLGWPGALLVERESDNWSYVVEDPLVWCLAASKTSGDVFLLNRRPALERLNACRRLVLIFPERT